MHTINMDGLARFAQDLYDVLGMNTDFCTQQRFFDQYVMDDNSFMIDQYTDRAVIYFDDYTITIKPTK